MWARVRFIAVRVRRAGGGTGDDDRRRVIVVMEAAGTCKRIGAQIRSLTSVIPTCKFAICQPSF